MKKKRIVYEIQKCRFLKRFFDQKCRFLKQNDDILNKILNFQNNNDDKNEIFFFTLSSENKISKLIINDLNFFNDFLTKKKTLSQYVLILLILTILTRQFL